MNKLIRDISYSFENLDMESCSHNIGPASYEIFAKAIIYECIKSIENAIDRFGPTVVDDIKETIKNHFGE